MKIGVRNRIVMVSDQGRENLWAYLVSSELSVVSQCVRLRFLIAALGFT